MFIKNTCVDVVKKYNLVVCEYGVFDLVYYGDNNIGAAF